jgi:hypothetical protein
MPTREIDSITPGSDEFNSYNGPAFRGYTGDGTTNTACNNGFY